jgi:hypothetical protein
MKLMGKDMNGLEVFENDVLVYDEGDFARFFRFENGKLINFATWTCGSLGLIDWNKFYEEVVNGDGPPQHKTFHKETDEWLKVVTPNQLNLISDEMKSHIDEMMATEGGFIALGDEIDFSEFQIIKEA